MKHNPEADKQADELRAAFRANLRRILQAREITGPAFSRLAGLHESQFYDLLNGKGYPGLLMISRCSAALAVKPAVLLDVSGIT